MLYGLSSNVMGLYKRDWWRASAYLNLALSNG
jgi:hypothetical protein